MRYFFQLNSKQKIGGESQNSNLPVSSEMPNEQNLLQWELFGRSDIGPTSLQHSLQLAGIFMADDETLRAAVIFNKENEPALYNIGSQLPDGFELKMILPDKVIIQKGGHNDVLNLIDIENEQNAVEGKQYLKHGPLFSPEEAQIIRGSPSNQFNNPEFIEKLKQDLMNEKTKQK